MSIREIREILGVSCDDLSRIYDIPITLIENWDDEKIVPPDWLLRILERMIREDKKYLRKCPSCERFFIDRRKGHIKYCPQCNEKGKSDAKRYATRKNGIRWQHKNIYNYIRNVLSEDPTEFLEKSNKFYQDVKAGTKTEEEYGLWLNEISAALKEKCKHSEKGVPTP